MSSRIRPPSGRAGPRDGLPTGDRVAALWRDAQEGDSCYQRNTLCRGQLVTVHRFDTAGQHAATVACVGHSVARHSVHPAGNPTASYIAAVTP